MWSLRVSPRARKESAGDRLMTAGSYIKYTAAGGKWGYSLGAGGGQTEAQACTEGLR